MDSHTKPERIIRPFIQKKQKQPLRIQFLHHLIAIVLFIMMVPTLDDREYYSNQGMDWQQSPNVVRYPAMTPTDDLLGFDELSMSPHPPRSQQQPFQTPTQSLQQQQQQQPQQQVFNAAQATITTMNTTAPSIAGIGKIEPSSARSNNSEQQMKPKRKVIYVPTYSCNGGFDTKVC
jgi:hypothetical protein